MQHPDQEKRAIALVEFRRMIFWVIIAGVMMTIGALIYLAQYGPLRLHMVVATIGGVFFSVLLGSGLFAAAFFSDKSGHDDKATIKPRRDPDEPSSS